MEIWDKKVKENLHGSAYLNTWENLPYSLKCIIAGSMYEAFHPHLSCCDGNIKAPEPKDKAIELIDNLNTLQESFCKKTFRIDNCTKEENKLKIKGQALFCCDEILRATNIDSGFIRIFNYFVEVKKELEKCGVDYEKPATLVKGKRMTKEQVRKVLEYSLQKGYTHTGQLTDKEVDTIIKNKT